MTDSLNLGADIYDLFHAGHVKMPTLATQFTTADGETGTPYMYVWMRDDLGYGGSGPYSAWSGLRDALSGFLTASASNANDIGTALVLAANEYAKTDAAASAEFQRLRQQNGI